MSLYELAKKRVRKRPSGKEINKIGTTTDPILNLDLIFESESDDVNYWRWSESDDEDALIVRGGRYSESLRSTLPSLPAFLPSFPPRASRASLSSLPSLPSLPPRSSSLPRRYLEEDIGEYVTGQKSSIWQRVMKFIGRRLEPPSGDDLV